jgi:acetoin utilization protein AcuC
VHEAGRWPYSGALGDRGGGQARNIPVPPAFNDDEMDYVLEGALLPLAHRFAPQFLILQLGADALHEDPLSKLELSNGALWRAIAALKTVAPRVLALGGGGYNPWSVARCWAGNWLVLNDMAVPATLPFAAETVLRALNWEHSRGRNPPDHWFTTLADEPRTGPIREPVRAAVADVLR